MSEKPLYTRWSIRDYSLPIIEIWCRAETTDPRQWTDKMQPKKPYILFVRRGGLVYDYTDHTGIDWIKGELLRLLANDPAYPEHLVGEFNKRMNSIKPFWEQQTELDREKLTWYLRTLRDAWAWFDGVWWLMEFAPPGSKASLLASEARKSSEQVVPSSDLLIKKSLLNIYPQLNRLSEMLLYEEIKTDSLPSRTELEQRAKAYAYADRTLFTDEDESDMERRFNILIEKPEKSDMSEVRIIKGQIACRGVARGKVRKIESRDDVPLMRKGEILVSSMTIPGFLPAMQKAAAIVTNEGGIASHVAIIARELGKPCVMGTSIATDVLNDGDMVEVNGDKGIVRKI